MPYRVAAAVTPPGMWFAKGEGAWGRGWVLYRRIMEAIGYFGAPIDPFQQQKDAGLTSAEAPMRSLATQLAAVADTLGAAGDKELTAAFELFVLTALWGTHALPVQPSPILCHPASPTRH